MLGSFGGAGMNSVIVEFCVLIGLWEVILFARVGSGIGEMVVGRRGGGMYYVMVGWGWGVEMYFHSVK